MSTNTNALTDALKRKNNNRIKLEDKKESVDKKADSLANSILGNYTIKFHGSIHSKDIPNAFFTNKYNVNDRPMIRKIKHLIKYDGKSVKVDSLPLSLEDNGDVILYNKKTDSDPFKKARFDKVCDSYGISNLNARKQLKKYPYSYGNDNKSNSSIRIVCTHEKNILDVFFLDVHHLLATNNNDATKYDQKSSYCNNCISELLK